jgi:hypothetical protein
VACSCDPSYLGGRDQEDSGSKPAWANSSLDPILKKPITKIGLVEWLKLKALSSNPSTKQQQQKKNRTDTYPRRRNFVQVMFLFPVKNRVLMN